MLAIGIPALALWGLDENGNPRSDWILLLPRLLVPAARLLHRFTKAPRPDLSPATELDPLRWDLAIAAGSGELPPRSPAQAAAALVCWQVDKTVLVGAAAIGATITWTTRAVWLWLVLAALCTAVGVVACQNIEGVVVGFAMVVSVVLSALAAPGFPRLGALGVLVIRTGISAFRVRRSWVCLRALHPAGRPV